MKGMRKNLRLSRNLFWELGALGVNIIFLLHSYWILQRVFLQMMPIYGKEMKR
jgi:hypothetical protein